VAILVRRKTASCGGVGRVTRGREGEAFCGTRERRAAAGEAGAADEVRTHLWVVAFRIERELQGVFVSGAGATASAARSIAATRSGA